MRLLRRDGDPLARVSSRIHPPVFSIYDDEDQLAIIKAAYRHLGLDEKFMQYRAALSQHQPRQEYQEDAAGFLRASQPDPPPASRRDLRGIRESLLRNANALDFDDLLLEAVRLLHARRRHARGLQPPR